MNEITWFWLVTGALLVLASIAFVLFALFLWVAHLLYDWLDRRAHRRASDKEVEQALTDWHFIDKITSNKK